MILWRQKLDCEESFGAGSPTAHVVCSVYAYEYDL
jgi:hypothetical protein